MLAMIKRGERWRLNYILGKELFSSLRDENDYLSKI